MEYNYSLLLCSPPAAAFMTRKIALGSFVVCFLLFGAITFEFLFLLSSLNGNGLKLTLNIHFVCIMCVFYLARFISLACIIYLTYIRDVIPV